MHECTSAHTCADAPVNMRVQVRAAPPDELYRSKGIVPLSFAEAEAEAARQGLPSPKKEQVVPHPESTRNQPWCPVTPPL